MSWYARSQDALKYLDGKKTRSEMVQVMCNGCGATLNIRSGNRQYKAQTAAGFPVTVYCIACEDEMHRKGRFVPRSGIPRCITCGEHVELATHGGVLYGDCPNHCKEGWYLAKPEGGGTRITEPPAVVEAVINLLELQDELTDQA